MEMRVKNGGIFGFFFTRYDSYDLDANTPREGFLFLLLTPDAPFFVLPGTWILKRNGMA